MLCADNILACCSQIKVTGELLLTPSPNLALLSSSWVLAGGLHYNCIGCIYICTQRAVLSPFCLVQT